MKHQTERSSPDKHPSWFNLRNGTLTVGLILAIALVIRIIFFTGVFAIDDFNYLRHAAQIWKGLFDLKSVQFYHGTRFLIFVPVSFFFALFGVSQITAVLWPLTASLCTVALIYRIGCILHSREAGIYCALLATALPIMVNEATWVVPGTFIGLVCAVSLLLFFQAEAKPRRWRLRLFLAGAVFALMPLAGQLGYILVLFFPLALLLYRHRPVFSYWPLIAGAGATLTAGVLLYWIQTGDPLAGIEVTRSVLSADIPPFRPFFYIKQLVRPVYSQGGLIYLLIIGFITAVLSRRKSVILAASWFLATWLIMEFASTSLSEYRPIFKMGRYIIVLTIPGVLLGGMGIAELRRLAIRIKPVSRLSPKGYLVSVLVMVAFFGSSIYFLHKFSRRRINQRKKIERVAEYVRQWEGETIYVTHWIWNSRVAFFMDYSADYFPSGYHPYHAVAINMADSTSSNRYVQTLQSGEVMNPGLLLFDQYLYEVTIGREKSKMLGEGEIPPLPAELPDTWNLVDTIDMKEGKLLKLYSIKGGRWKSHSYRP